MTEPEKSMITDEHRAVIGVKSDPTPVTVKEEDARRTIALLERLGLPTDHELLDVALCRRALRSAVLHRGGRLNLVVPTAIGSADFVRDPAVVTDEILERGIRRLRTIPTAHRWELVPAVTRQAHAAAACASL